MSVVLIKNYDDDDDGIIHCKVGYKLVLFTNRKSHKGFRSVPKSLTLNSLIDVIMYYFTQNSSFQSQLRQIH